MKEVTIRKIFKIYWLGTIPIILTPLMLATMADITIKLSDNLRIAINMTLYIIGYYILPTQTFWIMDIKEPYNNVKKIKKGKIIWE